MPTFQISTPDGKSYQVSAPDADTAYREMEGAGLMGSTSGSAAPSKPPSAQAPEAPGFVHGVEYAGQEAAKGLVSTAALPDLAKQGASYL